MKKLVLRIMLMLFLVSMFSMAFNIELVRTKPKTWIVDDDGPADFHTIQEAINAANPGDAIFVKAGTYYENLVVNKTLSFFGEDKNMTIIDAQGSANGITITTDNVTINNFTIQNSKTYYGIKLDYVKNCTITSNTITNTTWAIVLEGSSSSNISSNLVVWSNIRVDNSLNNSISHNLCLCGGIYLYNSISNNIKNNKVLDGSIYLSHADNHYIIRNELAHGHCSIKLYGSSNNYVKENLITDNKPIGGYGIEISDVSSNNVILQNEIIDCYYGIYLVGSSLTTPAQNNTIKRNSIVNNTYSIHISYSYRNRIFHNNLIKNERGYEVDAYTSLDLWDGGYPSGGNYWSDYDGTDFNSGPYQNETGSDGIGDIPYLINTNNVDHYPLMGPFSSFNTSLGYSVDIISNSTIEDFEYFESNNTIIMHVSNITSNQTYGFCRLVIPYELVAPPFNITVNNNPVEYNTIFENETLSIIYFSYEHSTLEIIIVPEFPLSIILLTFLILTTIPLVLVREKHHKRKANRKP